MIIMLAAVLGAVCVAIAAAATARQRGRRLIDQALVAKRRRTRDPTRIFAVRAPVGNSGRREPIDIPMEIDIEGDGIAPAPIDWDGTNPP